MEGYTDIAQSVMLTKILPIKSADMRYAPFGDIHPWVSNVDLIEKDAVPCWSIAALLDQLICPRLEKHISGKWDCIAFTDNTLREVVKAVDCLSAVHACVEVIVKLKEKDLI